VHLRFREKQSFYHSLGQLLRSGVTFPAALQSLSRSSRGGLRQLLKQLNQAITGGLTVAEAFAAQRPMVSEMEAGVVAAVERAGRLDYGLAQLAEYFGALDAARAGVIKKAAYPVFVLHFGIFALGIQTLVTSGLPAYLREIGSVFAVLYSAALVIVLAATLLKDLAATSPTVDSLLRLIPVIGRIRTNFAVSRFCATYEMQLGAGVNVMDGLKSAARAARSGLISSSVKRVIPEVLAGGQVGPLLGVSQAFPEETIRGISVGEETGKLDEELNRLAAEHQRAGIAALDTLAEWLPRMIYLATCIYIGYRVVMWYGGYLQQIQQLTDGI
jgi:type II secretory pathway component PulF